MPRHGPRATARLGIGMRPLACFHSESQTSGGRRAKADRPIHAGPGGGESGPLSGTWRGLGATVAECRGLRPCKVRVRKLRPTFSGSRWGAQCIRSVVAVDAWEIHARPQSLQTPPSRPAVYQDFVSGRNDGGNSVLGRPDVLGADSQTWRPHRMMHDHGTRRVSLIGGITLFSSQTTSCRWGIQRPRLDHVEEIVVACDRRGGGGPRGYTPIVARTHKKIASGLAAEACSPRVPWSSRGPSFVATGTRPLPIASLKCG